MSATALRGTNGRFGRVATAMVTPFTPSGALDTERAAELACRLRDQGSDTIVVNGTTGESPTTTTDEKIQLVRAVADAIGSDRVIAGAGGYSTAAAVELAKRSRDAGAGALLAVTGYYNKPSQEGLYQHFKAVAAATELTVLLYNVPGRTITNIEAATNARVAQNCPTVVGTKEASANLPQIGEILRSTPDSFAVYSGDDGTTLPILSLGGAGVISVISHVVGPDIQELHRAWFAGERARAAAVFLKTLPITRALFSAPSPGPVKYALKRLGFDTGGVRLPLVELCADEQRVVEDALAAYGLM